MQTKRNSFGMLQLWWTVVPPPNFTKLPIATSSLSTKP
jgi:hypothetical protein